MSEVDDHLGADGSEQIDAEQPRHGVPDDPTPLDAQGSAQDQHALAHLDLDAYGRAAGAPSHARPTLDDRARAPRQVGPVGPAVDEREDRRLAVDGDRDEQPRAPALLRESDSEPVGPAPRAPYELEFAAFEVDSHGKPTQQVGPEHADGALDRRARRAEVSDETGHAAHGPVAQVEPREHRASDPHRAELADLGDRGRAHLGAGRVDPRGVAGRRGGSRVEEPAFALDVHVGARVAGHGFERHRTARDRRAQQLHRAAEGQREDQFRAGSSKKIFGSRPPEDRRRIGSPGSVSSGPVVLTSTMLITTPAPHGCTSTSTFAPRT